MLIFQTIQFFLGSNISFSLFLCLQSPDGKHLATGAIDGIINIFDIATGKLLHTLEGENRLPHDSSCLQFPLLKRGVCSVDVESVSLLESFRVIMGYVNVVEKPVCVSGRPSRAVNFVSRHCATPFFLFVFLHRSITHSSLSFAPTSTAGNNVECQICFSFYSITLTVGSLE